MDADTLSEVTKGVPVGTELVPYVPECAYKDTDMGLVGLPVFLIRSTISVNIALTSEVKDWPLKIVVPRLALSS